MKVRINDSSCLDANKNGQLTPDQLKYIKSSSTKSILGLVLATAILVPIIIAGFQNYLGLSLFFLAVYLMVAYFCIDYFIQSKTPPKITSITGPATFLRTGRSAHLHINNQPVLSQPYFVTIFKENETYTVYHLEKPKIVLSAEHHPNKTT